jgi:HEXXH motif-containing protein
MVIDWSRIAKPQEDGYDVAVLNSMDAVQFGWRKLEPTTPVTLADGAIAVRPTRYSMSMGSGATEALDLTQAWADDQTRYLSAWTAGYRALRGYMDELWPWWSEHTGKGCSSGHHVMTDTLNMRAVYVTVNDRQGCAQGMYHEMAHVRLRTLGIHMDTHTGMLLTNGDDERFNSPVRFDIKRPMPAVLQGLYAWLMFIENDWQLMKAGVSSDDDFGQYTFHNLPKIANGIAEVKKFARTTNAGAAFLQGIYDWSDDLLTRCHADAKRILGADDYARRF